MPIAFFEQNDSASSSRLPFVEDYVEKHDPPYKLLEVISIRRTRKRTGYMLDCADYCVFLFEGSNMLQHLLEALNQWVETKQGYQLFVQASATDPYYLLGVDEDKPATWILTQGKYSWLQGIGSGSDAAHTQNPFLPQTRKTTRTRHKSAETPDTYPLSGS